MSYVLKKDLAGRHMFNLKAANGEIILTSQSYADKAGALNGIESVRTNCLLDKHYERLKSSAGEPYFTLKASNGLVIGRSEMYSSESARETGIAAVKKNGTSAAVKDES